MPSDVTITRRERIAPADAANFRRRKEKTCDTSMPVPPTGIDHHRDIIITSAARVGAVEGAIAVVAVAATVRGEEVECSA